MNIELPLKQMSLAEKLRIMELLWDDLCRQEKAPSSPDWHREILQTRAKRIEEGKSEFMDWNEAKNKIREKCHEDSNT